VALPTSDDGAHKKSKSGPSSKKGARSAYLLLVCLVRSSAAFQGCEALHMAARCMQIAAAHHTSMKAPCD
jgi:hypothetical protein